MSGKTAPVERRVSAAMNAAENEWSAKRETHGGIDNIKTNLSFRDSSAEMLTTCTGSERPRQISSDG